VPCIGTGGDLETPTRAFHRQQGLTLIEVLITLVLLSILVVGLTGLWSNVSEHFLSLTIRQKAVFVLNGEMARLSALYRFANFRGDTQETDNSDSPPAQQYINLGVDREIYPLTSASAAVVGDIVTQDGPTFACGDSDCAALILYDSNGPDTDDDRNYVWIDQARNITGRLSWEAKQEAGNCSDGTIAGAGDSPEGTEPCEVLTVYLEFPFRFVDGTIPDAPAGFGKIHQMSLMTIVGRRR
jgi:prepilin-type N-terminal cleavage/methylation domain-containing protein